MENGRIAQRSAIKAETDNLDGLSGQSNASPPDVAGRDRKTNTDEAFHRNHARLEASVRVGDQIMASSPHPAGIQSSVAARAQGTLPDTLGVRQNVQGVPVKAQSLLNGKRKRSVGQDADVHASPAISPAKVVSTVTQQTDHVPPPKGLSPPMYFPSSTIIHNGPTPPMSPVANSEKKAILDESAAVTGSLSATKVESLKRNLKTQIGLEILQKHNELRLIDQELAKCQTAFEQLRRCTEIPYPATKLSLEVSNGVGPPRTASTGPLPRSPAPWGVTDGPYSRHYAKWLLPDPTFDHNDEQFATSQHSEFARSTRGKPIETVAGTSKRGNKSKAPLVPNVPRDKSGPMIIKRKSDGKMVKLRCLDCARDDFGSAQGFINHCRIQHHRNFTSHDAAAAACGEVVEVDPAGASIGAPPPVPSAVFSSGAVHPLIRSAHLIKRDPEVAEVKGDAVLSEESRSPDSHTALSSSPNLSAFTSPPHFQPSPLAPNLSALIHNRGLGINLQDLVQDAKNTTLPDDDDSGSDMDVDTPVTKPFSGQHPQVAGTKQPASPSHPRQGGKTSSFGQLRGGAMLSSLHSPGLPDLEHEPSPTNESNQAPSLVDDDEDDYFEGHSPTSSAESNDDGSELNFHIEDEDGAGPSTLSPLYPDSGKQQLEGLEGRPSAIRRGFRDSKEEKHVSFVSPSPVRDMAGHDAKRRKM